jgi:hypothetical protein
VPFIVESYTLVDPLACQSTSAPSLASWTHTREVSEASLGLTTALTGQWWSYFRMHRLHIRQWCALSSHMSVKATGLHDCLTSGRSLLQRLHRDMMAGVIRVDDHLTPPVNILDLVQSFFFAHAHEWPG